jgi:hypothetical protein
MALAAGAELVAKLIGSMMISDSRGAEAEIVTNHAWCIAEDFVVGWENVWEAAGE